MTPSFVIRFTALSVALLVNCAMMGAVAYLFRA